MDDQLRREPDESRVTGDYQDVADSLAWDQIGQDQSWARRGSDIQHGERRYLDARPAVNNVCPQIPSWRCATVLTVDEQKNRLLERFLDLLYAEPKRLNLTRVQPEDAWTRHVQESLDLIPMRTWSPGERVIDLGSGAGFPGIPLAIALPHLQLVLIERDQAKAAFLLSALGRLHLTGVQVLAGDASELLRRPDFEAGDVLVSRAALPVPKLLALAAQLLRSRGEGLVHVGKSV
ncbi:MAG: 16S rRNA (guanine(527)-N(7))-methyltransferase RsmG, partial [Candidatus Dormiibacterota bacterium]